MTPLVEGMDVRSVEGLPKAPGKDAHVDTHDIPIMDVDVLVIGGGPAGLSGSGREQTCNRGDQSHTFRSCQDPHMQEIRNGLLDQ